MPWPEPPAERPAGPLSGVRILDLSRILAGPFAMQALADLGADVIKVERKGAGDETRRWGPPFTAAGDATYFAACNRGRRSIALDLGDEGDRAVVLALVAEADVLLENFLPGAMDRLGLSDAVLAQRNPRLVHGVVSGYASDSAQAMWPAYDFVIQAHAGIIGVTGPDGAAGVKAGVPIADLTAGLFLGIGLLAALRRAEATGVGARVEVALAEACTALLSNQAMNHLIGGLEPRPMGNAHPNIAPYEVVRAADRPFAVAATSEVQFARLCTVLGTPELIGRYPTNASRVADRAAVIAALEERLTQRDASAWVTALNEAGVPAALVNSVSEVLAESALVTEAGGVPQLRTPIRIDGAPLAPAGPLPALGEHGPEIRAAL